MIPVLYGEKENEFLSNGIGKLTEAVSCEVTEERNGMFELVMQYPVSGARYPDLKMDALILAEPGDGRTRQAFRIYKISKPIGGIVTVSAEHISYQLSHIPVAPFSAGKVGEALTGLKGYAVEECPFEFWTDKGTDADFSVSVPKSLRACLGGSEGSILDVYGGEYEFDNYTVKLYQERGEDAGVTLRYGKNITDLTQEENISSVVTGVYPYWTGGEDQYLELPEKMIHAEGAENYSFPRTIPLDCSSDFEEMPTEEQLRGKAASYIKQNGIGVPKVSIKISFTALWQTEEYKEIAPLERVRLCDTVRVEFAKLGISAKAKVIKTKYNVLLDRYDSIELGEARSNLATTIAGQQATIEERTSVNFLRRAVESATAWITGVNGGYVVFRRDANGQPYEILIMDTPNIETAMNVWRWNQGGLGHSSNGYNGPYTAAITQDGKIVADFVTTGTMLANIIKGGILTLGGKENGNGECVIRDADGKEIARIDKDGITAAKGTFSGIIEALTGKIGPFSLTGNSLIAYGPEGDIKSQWTKQEDGSYAFYTGTVWAYNNLNVQGRSVLSQVYIQKVERGGTAYNTYTGNVVVGNQILRFASGLLYEVASI